MAKKPRRRAFDPNQLQLLAALERTMVTETPAREQAPAGLDLDQKVRRWLHEAIDLSPLSREQIGEAMTALCGREVTKPMLDSWTGASRPNRFPLDLLPSFCAAVGNNYVLEKLAEPIGVVIADTVSAKLARLGRQTLLIALATEQQKALAASLAGMPLFQGGK